MFQKLIEAVNKLQDIFITLSLSSQRQLQLPQIIVVRIFSFLNFSPESNFWNFWNNLGRVPGESSLFFYYLILIPFIRILKKNLRFIFYSWFAETMKINAR